MAYLQIHTAPAQHIHARGIVHTLLAAGAPTKITHFDLNTIEVQRGDTTMRFQRMGSEQTRSDFDELLELVGQYPHLAAYGVCIPVRER